jgi:transcriptional regulator with XRE-family HTH domain
MRQMVVSTEEPAVQRRRLRVELRTYRKRAGLTQRDVAKAMDWSPSKLIRMENGDVRIAPTDLRVLLGHYGVSDPETVESLVDMARSSRRDTWGEFKDVYTQPWLTFLGYESSASVVRNYETLLVPGLLQTEEYALAWYRASGVDKEAAERRWEGRLRRQELHDRDNPPDMNFVIDQAAVARQVGGQGVLRRQLERLKSYGQMKHITLQIVPFTSGWHEGLGESFVLLEFPSPDDDDLLHIEDPGGGVTMRDDTDQTSAALERFVSLEDFALPPEETLELLDHLIDESMPRPTAVEPQEAP